MARAGHRPVYPWAAYEVLSICAEALFGDRGHLRRNEDHMNFLLGVWAAAGYPRS
jgi:hypothetical protein